jgi:hypothetical protein
MLAKVGFLFGVKRRIEVNHSDPDLGALALAK